METHQQLGDLPERAKGGDRAAFEKLVEPLRGRLRSWVDIRLGKSLRNHVEVEDVLQDTFLQALRSISVFDWRGEEAFLYWLSRIAENVILVAADRAKRSRHAPLAADVADHDVSQSKACRRRERFDRLQRALDALEPDHRKVILLSRLEGLSLKEVALRMNRTPNAVSHLLMRALRKLRDIFGDTESLHLPHSGRARAE